jgi:predicted nucleic acid-binding protein
MIVLDTTVLVYAKGGDHPLREPCRTLMEAVVAKAVEATTTPEVVQEYAHVRARRTGRAVATAEALDLLGVLGPLLATEEASLALGLRLYEETPGVGSFDAVLAAAAITLGADALVSADRGFTEVKGLFHLDPGAPDFLERLGIG